VEMAPLGQPLELARLCSGLLDDTGKRRTLGERGARLYRDRFSLDRTVETVLSASDDKLARVQ